MYYYQQPQQFQPKPQIYNKNQANEVKQTLMEMFGDLGEEIISIILQENKYQLEPTLEALLKLSDKQNGGNNQNQNNNYKDEEDDTIFNFKSQKNEQGYRNNNEQIRQLRGEDDGIQVDLEDENVDDDEQDQGNSGYNQQKYAQNYQKKKYNQNQYENDKEYQDRKTVQKIQEEEDMKLAYALQQKYMQQENKYLQQQQQNQQMYQQQPQQKHKKKQQKQNNQNNNQQQYFQYSDQQPNLYSNQQQQQQKQQQKNQQQNIDQNDEDMLPEGFQYQNNYQDLIKPKKSVKQRLTDAKSKFLKLFNKKKKEQQQSIGQNNNAQQQMNQINQQGRDGGEHDDQFVGQLIDFEDEDENLHKKNN